MTKSRVAVAAVAVAVALAAASTGAQAGSRWVGPFAVGVAGGALLGAAVASSAYTNGPYYRECRYVERYDRWGNLRVIKVCDAY